MPPPNTNTTLSLQLPMKFSNIVGVEPYDINEDHDTAEARFLQPSIRLRYNYYIQLGATKRGWIRVPNLKIWSPRGVEAGRAHHCKRGARFRDVTSRSPTSGRFPCPLIPPDAFNDPPQQRRPERQVRRFSAIGKDGRGKSPNWPPQL